MKKLWKALGFMLAWMLALAFPIAARARQTASKSNITIAIDGAAGNNYTYEAYQIFAGDAVSDGNKTTLSNITFGSGIDTDKFKSMEAFQSVLAEEVPVAAGEAVNYADVLQGLSSDTEALKAFADSLINDKILTVPSGTYDADTGTIGLEQAGYYLIKSSGSSTPATVAILEVVETAVTVSPKAATVPGVFKYVKDTSQALQPVSESDTSLSDQGFADTFLYKVVTTVPEGLSSYYGQNYVYIIHDTTNENIQADYETLSVSIGDTLLEKGTDYTVTLTDTGADIAILNMASADKAQVFTAGSEISVVYEAVFKDTYKKTLSSLLSPESLTEYEGTAWVEYTVDPYAQSPTDTTEEASAVVFNYSLKVIKTDGVQALQGAEFSVTASGQSQSLDESEEEIAGGVLESGNEFAFYGLREGVTYTLTETITPAGYNTITPIEFSITSGGFSVSLDGGYLVKVDGAALSSQSQAEFSYDEAAKLFTVTIANKKGTVLPSTGGAGTLLMAITGAVFLFGAGLFLVTNKRIQKENL